MVFSEWFKPDSLVEITAPNQFGHGKTIEKRKLVIDVKYFFFYVHLEPRDI